MKRYEHINHFLDDSSIFYTIVIGMNSLYHFVSKNYNRNFDLTNGSLLGKHFSITLHPDDIKLCEKAGAECFANPGKLISVTLRKHNGKGGFVTTQWEMQAYFDDDGQPGGIFCIGYNITEFVDTRSQLHSAHTQLDDIAFIQSHIVRKPLANIIGLTNLIQQEVSDERLNHFCEMLKQSAEELDGVVKDISNKTKKN